MEHRLRARQRGGRASIETLLSNMEKQDCLRRFGQTLDWRIRLRIDEQDARLFLLKTGTLHAMLERLGLKGGYQGRWFRHTRTKRPLQCLAFKMRI